MYSECKKFTIYYLLVEHDLRQKRIRSSHYFKRHKECIKTPTKTIMESDAVFFKHVSYHISQSHGYGFRELL